MKTKNKEAWEVQDEGSQLIIVDRNAKTLPAVCRVYAPQKKLAKVRANLIAAAPELLLALEKITAHYDDLSKSNPGFMGKLVLQDYALWNDALMSMRSAIAKAKGGS